MTVREAVAFLPKVDVYYVTYDASNYKIDPEDAFLMAAFGDFDVKRVDNGYTTDPNEKAYELIIACKPLKNGVPV